MRRTLGVVMTVLGLLLMSGAAVVHWAVAPAMSKLPGDTHTTRLYAGHAASLVNPTYATDVPSGPGVLHDVTIAIRHTTRVLDTTSNTALVSDRRVVTLPGFVAADLSYRYAVDRRTFQAAGGFPGIVAASGLTFNWPMNAKRHDYVGWVQDTLMTTPLRYVATVRHGGIRTYEYTARAGDQVISDPVLSRVLPATMTKADMMLLTPSLGLTTKQLLSLDAVVTRAPDPVPLAYSYRFAATFWVAPDSGIVVDMRQHEMRTTNIVDRSGLVPVAPLMDMSYAFTPASVTGAVGDAKSAVDQLNLINRTVPVTALVVGIALLVGGLVLLAVPRRRHPAVPEGPWVDELLEQREPILV
jgi:hypothetical protein